MGNIDKTKKNIGISNLDDRTKKDLFDKFINGGGKVIKDKKNKVQTIDRKKQAQYKKNLDKHRKKIQTTPKKITAQKKSSTTKKSTPPKVPKTDSGKIIGFSATFFMRLKIKFRLKLMNIAQLNGLYFNIKFLQKFNNIYKPALIEIQMAYLSIFKKNPQIGREITGQLDQRKPIYYETIEMIGTLYNKISADQIVDHYVNFPDVPKKISELKEPLLDIYKKLFILKPYENIILNAFERALLLQLKIENKKPSFNSATRKKVKNSLFILFHKLFPRLHWLFCHYEGKIIEIYDPIIENILSITPEDKPGNRKVYKQDHAIRPETTEGEAAEEGSAPDDDTEKDDMADAVKKGMKLIYQLDLKQLYKEYAKSGLFENVNEKDNVIIAYLLFNEFDKEYSFILTTNKIKYNVNYGERGKLDYKTRLHDLYDEMRTCFDSFKNYSEIILIHEKASKEKPTGNNQFIQHSKRLDDIKKKKDQSGKKALTTVKTFVDKVIKELINLIDDMNGPQKYLANPQDSLYFESRIEGNKKLNEKKIYEAIITVLNYAAALSDCLEYGKDYSDYLNFYKKESNTQNENEIPGSSPEIKNGEDSEQKSILEELDDFI